MKEKKRKKANEALKRYPQKESKKPECMTMGEKGIILIKINRQIQLCLMSMRTNLFLKSEAKHRNLDTKAQYPIKYANKIKRLEVAIADLFTILEVINDGKMTAKIYGISEEEENCDYLIYTETTKALEKSGLTWTACKENDAVRINLKFMREKCHQETSKKAKEK